MIGLLLSSLLWIQVTPPVLSDVQKLELAVLQRDLSATQAQLNQLLADYNATHERLVLKATELNAVMDKLKKEGCTLDSAKLEYQCAAKPSP
jgi:hypothetical protein